MLAIPCIHRISFCKESHMAAGGYICMGGGGGVVVTFTTYVSACLHTSSHNLLGTGMIASSSTFCPHLGRVIRDLFRQLHAVWHGTEALVYRNHPREFAASSLTGHNLWADCQ